MQVRAILAGFVKEITNADWSFKRKCGIEGTPGERDGAGTLLFRFVAWPDVASAGKFTFERTSISPIFWMCHECHARRSFEKTLGHIFIGEHILSLLAAHRAILPGWNQYYGVSLYYRCKGDCEIGRA